MVGYRAEKLIRVGAYVSMHLTNIWIIHHLVARYAV